MLLPLRVAKVSLRQSIQISEPNTQVSTQYLKVVLISCIQGVEICIAIKSCTDKPNQYYVPSRLIFSHISVRIITESYFNPHVKVLEN